METTDYLVGTGSTTADTVHPVTEYPDRAGIIDGQPDHDGMLQTALRVLRAINNHEQPGGMDLAILQLAFPGAIPHDELACEVIQGVARMRCRSETRGHLAWKTG